MVPGMVVRSSWVCKGELINTSYCSSGRPPVDRTGQSSDPAWGSVGWTLGIVIRSQSKKGHRGKGKEVKHGRQTVGRLCSARFDSHTEELGDCIMVRGTRG